MTYTEDKLVEQPTINLFANIGWQTLDCYSETFNTGNGEEATLGRANRAEVTLVRELRAALIKINPDCTTNEITLAVDEITRDRSVMSAVTANEQRYKLLREGVKVKSDDGSSLADGSQDYVTVKVVDWQNTNNNQFLLCSQLWITGEIETRH